MSEEHKRLGGKLYTMCASFAISIEHSDALELVQQKETNTAQQDDLPTVERLAGVSSSPCLLVSLLTMLACRPEEAVARRVRVMNGDDLYFNLPQIRD